MIRARKVDRQVVVYSLRGFLGENLVFGLLIDKVLAEL
jgi:hypothetical protein